MGVETNTLYMSAISVLLSIVTIVNNAYVLSRFVLKRHGASQKHISMLIVKIFFDTSFALATIVYSSCVILHLTDLVQETTILYMSGNVIQSLEAAMSILIIFIALDRLCAMRKPLHYSKLYGELIHKVAVVVLAITFTTCFVAYALTKRSNVNGHVFTQLVNRLVQSIIHSSTVAVLVAGIAVTIIFLREFKMFLHNRNTGAPYSYSSSAKNANRVVVYLMAVEFVCLIIPNTLELVLRIGFNIRLGSFGPVIHPLFVLYIAISSVMFLMTKVGKSGSTPGSTVQAVQTSQRWMAQNSSVMNM